jgi:hypothetical protein
MLANPLVQRLKYRLLGQIDTWWRHAKGMAGAPGLVIALTRNGLTDLKEVIR